MDQSAAASFYCWGRVSGQLKSEREKKNARSGVTFFRHMQADYWDHFAKSSLVHGPIRPCHLPLNNPGLHPLLARSKPLQNMSPIAMNNIEPCINLWVVVSTYAPCSCTNLFLHPSFLYITTSKHTNLLITSDVLLFIFTIHSDSLSLSTIILFVQDSRTTWVLHAPHQKQSALSAQHSALSTQH